MGRLADFFREQSITLDGQKKTKMLSLDRQFEEMETERDSLKAENLSLKAQVNPLQRDVDRLKNQIEGMQGKAAKGHLEEVESKILVTLSTIPGKRGANAPQIADAVGINETKAEYHLTKLVEANFVHAAYFYTSTPTEYRLGQLGREYLVKNDLLK